MRGYLTSHLTPLLNEHTFPVTSSGEMKICTATLNSSLWRVFQSHEAAAGVAWVSADFVDKHERVEMRSKGRIRLGSRGRRRICLQTWDWHQTKTLLILSEGDNKWFKSGCCVMSLHLTILGMQGVKVHRLKGVEEKGQKKIKLQLWDLSCDGSGNLHSVLVIHWGLRPLGFLYLGCVLHIVACK